MRWMRSPPASRRGGMELIGLMDIRIFVGALETVSQESIKGRNAISLGGEMADGVILRNGRKGPAVLSSAAVVLPEGRDLERVPGDRLTIVRSMPSIAFIGPVDLV